MSHAALSRRQNAEMNKLLPEDRPVHDWYRFVLSFPPHFVRKYLARFEMGTEHRVLDPFCGTGTTLVECKKMGIPSVGMEANSMAQFASRIKLDWNPVPERLLEHVWKVAKFAFDILEGDGICDEPDSLFSRKNRNGVRRKHALLKTLPPEQMNLLLGNSISPLPLHKTLVLLECLNTYRDERYVGHALLGLAKALVESISNLHFGPEVGVKPSKSDAPVIQPWLDAVEVMAADLHKVQSRRNVLANVHHADARDIDNVLPANSIDAVLTSPPYPNEKDYTRTTRLESVLLGFIRSKKELRQLKKRLVRSNTRGVYKADNDDEWISNHRTIQKIAKRIERRRIELGKTSGFERMYHRVTKLYFGGMARHFAQLRTVLRPGAQLAYVVGDQASYLQVMIRTGKLLGEIAESLGYEVVGLDLFRTRLATATRRQLREEVLLLRWPGR